MRKKALIMFVDDDQSILKAIGSGLRDRSFNVITAESGEEALNLVKTHKPNLFIIDLRMEPMNGFELYQHLKKNPKFTYTPTFFLTGIDDPLAKQYSSKLGVDAFLTKPVDLDHLEVIIRQKLKIKK